MRAAGVVAAAVVSLAAVPAAKARDAVVDFEKIAAGKHWGKGYGQEPGDQVTSQDGIKVLVESYHRPDGATEFGMAMVRAGHPESFPTKYLDMHLITAMFVFDALPSLPTMVTFEWFQGGTTQNLGVNGVLHVGKLETMPTQIAPGVTMSFSPGVPWLVPAFVTLTGEVSSLQIGGVESRLDNVRAVPAPGLAGMAVGTGIVVLRRVRRR